MLTVAHLRALGRQWPECAEATGLTAATCRNYPSRYTGWDDLVAHYRQEAFDEAVENHFLAGSREALQAIRAEFREAATQLAQMEEQAAAGELDAEEAAQAFGLSRAVVYAADKYLDNIGFQKYRERLAEMRAEEEATGKVGKTVHHEQLRPDEEEVAKLLGLEDE